MPFPHVGNGLMHVSRRYPFYGTGLPQSQRRRIDTGGLRRRRCGPAGIQSLARGVFARNVSWACATA
jgi:hypothetical protein